MERNYPFILWKLLLVAGFLCTASLLSLQGSFWCWPRQLRFLFASVSFWQLDMYVFIRNTEKDTGALFPGDYWQHRSNGGARKVQIWWKWKKNWCSLEAKTIPTAVSISANAVSLWAEQLPCCKQCRPALEIRLGRGLKVPLGSLMPPASCTSVLLQYSFLQLFHEMYLSLNVSHVQSMKGHRHKPHLWILLKSHLPVLQLAWEAAAWGSWWYMPGAKCSSLRWKLLLS